MVKLVKIKIVAVILAFSLAAAGEQSYSELIQENIDLQNQVSELKNELAQKNDTIARLNQALSRRTNELSSNKKSSRNTESELQEQMESLENRLQAKIAYLNTTIASLDTKIDILHRDKFDLTKKLTQKDRTITEKELQILGLLELARATQRTFPVTLAEHVTALKGSQQLPLYEVGSFSSILSGRPLIEHRYKPDASRDFPYISFWTESDDSRVLGITAFWQAADTIADDSKLFLNNQMKKISVGTLIQAAGVADMPGNQFVDFDYNFPQTGFVVTEVEGVAARQDYVGTWQVKALQQSSSKTEGFAAINW